MNLSHIFQRKHLGKLAVLSAVLLIFSLWILSQPNTASLTSRPFFSLGQITGLLGATLLSLSYVLSARLQFLESFFGGLDKMYHLHRLVASLGFVAVCFHPVFFAVNSLPSLNVLKYFLPSSNLPYTLGVLALFSYIILVVITVYLKIPYHIWKLTHQFMGVPLALFAFHIFLIPTNLRSFLPLQITLYAFLALGALSYLYKLTAYGRFGPKFKYLIKEVNPLGDVTEIKMEPKGKSLEFIPGQFVFVKFENPAVGRESHPFSISSGVGENYLRLSIKSLGDFTERVRLLRPGETAQIYGPYGAFRDDRKISGDQVWIAGGIGVTPFLSMLRSVPQNAAHKIWLFYCTRGMADAPYLKEIESEKAKRPSLNVIHYQSDTLGKITSKVISEKIAEIKNKKILLCGPKRMMEDLASGFRVVGVKNRNISYEDFSFLT